MRHHEMPKTVQKWINNNRDKVIEADDAWVEYDGYQPELGDYSIWICLTGYHNGDYGSHYIHESTAKDTLQALKWIEPCDCERCKEMQNN